MCGIAGFVNFDGHRREDALVRVRRMTDVLAHRGPDGEGVYVDGRAALGHRRLAIIDRAAGQQPMGVRDGAVQIVFNGEIYNFCELRAQLESRGHVFRTHSDTEVILRAYLEWGEPCVERLHGMFAFGIWDAPAQTLVLARDRVGKKPLYYYRDGAAIAFGSELKALRAGGRCREDVDPEGLDCYLTLGYVPSPRTIYRDVRKLAAASTLVVSATGARERRYWDLSFAHPTPRTLEAATDEFEALLDGAVERRLVGEVPLGAFLSGGLDSALVVSSMARVMDRPAMTNSIGFDDRAFDELPAARDIARHLGTDHHEFVVAPRAADVLERIAWHFDEPLADSSAVPTWYVCAMAKQAVTVALSGDGGDEAFGGYTFRYMPHLAESALRRRLPAALRGALFGPLGRLWPGSARLPKPLRLKTIFENLATGDAQAFYRDLRWLREDVRAELYSGAFLDQLAGFTPFETVGSFYTADAGADALGRAQYTDLHIYMTEDVLVKVDRMSMAHAVEVRSPLLDHRVLEFAAGLPPSLRMNRTAGKLPLRALAKRRLPRAVHGAVKRGFSIPAARWLRQELRPMVEDVVFGTDGPHRQVLRDQALRGLWAEHLAGSRDHSVLIWGVLMLALWSRQSTQVAAAA